MQYIIYWWQIYERTNVSQTVGTFYSDSREVKSPKSLAPLSSFTVVCLPLPSLGNGVLS